MSRRCRTFVSRKWRALCEMCTRGLRIYIPLIRFARTFLALYAESSSFAPKTNRCWLDEAISSEYIYGTLTGSQRKPGPASYRWFFCVCVSSSSSSSVVCTKACVQRVQQWRVHTQSIECNTQLRYGNMRHAVRWVEFDARAER